MTDMPPIGMFSRAVTQSRTETRTTQLARQINLFVSTVTGSSSFRETIMRAAEERWIEQVLVRLVGVDEKIRHEAILAIDWDDHSVALARSDRGLIAEKRFDSSTGWLGGALSELATDLAEIAREGRLTAHWSVVYTSSARQELEKVRTALGLSPAKELEWADGEKRTLWGPHHNSDLHELSVTWKGVIAARSSIEGKSQ
jgi:hypothetical protein